MRLLLVVSLLCILGCVQAQTEYLLYPEGAPGALGTEDKDKPAVKHYPPTNGAATGAAVLVCPGGGYAMLADDHEGKQIAEWYASLGIHAFVLRYRLGSWEGTGYRHPTMLNDVKRGLRFVRHHAKQYGYSADKIGVMGFSAGGHLASSLAVHFDDGNPRATDPIEQWSSLPNWCVLGYPVISFKEAYTHVGSRRFLLGPTPTQAAIDSMSTDTQVRPQSPPTFMFHTNEDRGVPPENSVAFYLALRKYNIPAELHIYEKGRHGVGFAQDDPILSTWKDRLHDWLGHRGAL